MSDIKKKFQEALEKLTRYGLESGMSVSGYEPEAWMDEAGDGDWILRDDALQALASIPGGEPAPPRELDQLERMLDLSVVARVNFDNPKADEALVELQRILEPMVDRARSRPPAAPTETEALGLWRCSGCGEALAPGEKPGTAWRWAGAHWEHQCGSPQAGHEVAYWFGSIPEPHPFLMAPAIPSGDVEKPILDQLADRFLCWKLPADFSPDCGITFKRNYNEGTPRPGVHEPIGTNLLTAIQAKEMLEYVTAPLLARITELEDELKRKGKMIGAQQALRDDLRAQLTEKERELDAAHDLMGGLLKRICHTLKGADPEMGMHSWHDLPELVEQLKVVDVEQEHRIAALEQSLDHANALLADYGVQPVLIVNAPPSASPQGEAEKEAEIEREAAEIEGWDVDPVLARRLAEKFIALRGDTQKGGAG